SHAWEGEPAAARGVLDEAIASLGESDLVVRSLQALAAAFEGDAAAARRLLVEQEAASDRSADRLVTVARVHVLLGDREAALAALGRARQFVDVDQLRTDPQLAVLRGDPRFDRLLAPLAPVSRARE